LGIHYVDTVDIVSLNVEKTDIFRHMDFKSDRPYDDLFNLPPTLAIESEGGNKGSTAA